MPSPVNREIGSSLRQNFLFSSLTDVEIDALAAELWVDQIPAGGLIVREADVADALFLVLAGGVNVTKANGHFLAYLGPGGFFGEMGLFMEGSQRSANCIAAVHTTCVVVRRETLDKFCMERAEAGMKIYRAIIRTLAERLQATSSDLAILMGTQVRPQATVSKMVEEARERRNATKKP